MLPLQQAREVRASVVEYIKATFRFKEKEVGDAFYRFIEAKKGGLFKGPYISLRTPFVSATEEESRKIPLDIAPSFPPYTHQLQAFAQLSLKDGHRPVPTLLTTGTGSGKTECFLYPILDYCYHCNRYERQVGVKVIIMYPMNALASDQAKRLAETIWNDERLRGKVTAGLFVGEGVNAKEHPRTMGEDHIIENRDAIIDTAPDILLTNFKMLDYGLMRQRFMPLWRGNIDSDRKALRFIVVDELHTYDGAQGTDVANLIRRLKLKLGLEKGWLCPVGTSATIGGGPDGKARLCAYATDVFGEEFSEEHIIGERRIPVDEYVSSSNDALPEEEQLKECVLKDSSVEEYIRRLCAVWLHNAAATPIEAGEALRRMAIVHDMLRVLDNGLLTLDELCSRMEESNEGFRRLRRQYSEETCLIVVENLLALIAYARRPTAADKTAPLLYLQVQLWQRELSGILRYVQEKPEFVWRDNLSADKDRVALPMYFCRDCGASGWISHLLSGDDRYCTDVKKVNKAFASRDKDVKLLNTDLPRHEPVEEYLAANADSAVHCVSLADLKKEAQHATGDTIRLRAVGKTTDTRYGRQKFSSTCPECNGQNTLCQVGGRTSTLSSVAVSQVLSSDLDHAPANERKMLMFTNSVQDAAHHAGFYEARTFRFLFRQSMQKYINTLSEPVSLVDLQQGFRTYWHEKISDDEYYSRFLPADLATHIDLRRNYRENGGYMPRFREEFELRVDWEITSEFALMAQIGRTLEKTGTSAAFFKSDLIRAVCKAMKPWMENNNMEAEARDEDRFCHYVYGILQRMRTHGAVNHPYLDKYRHEILTFWALNWNNDGRHFLNRKWKKNSRFPKPVGTTYTGDNSEMLDIAVLRNNNAHTWYSNYFSANFHNTPTISNPTLYNEFMQQLFDTMVAVGLLSRGGQGGGNYAIRPEAIWISGKVKHVPCSQCQSRLCVAWEDELAEGTHCIDYKCDGTYQKGDKPAQNYYQMVYNRELSPRVYARDHTGLLDRKDRERLERDFKEHPNANSTNVLTATSTLEMGIDIGNLNIVGNSDVPPKPANFLQRVGRAGRKEGAALVLNYAHASGPHDMYYFTYPEEMMQGEATTPGCFLEAKDILRRHFFAYCIDSWTSANANNELPARVADLHLAEKDTHESENFPIIRRLFGFIKDNKDRLCADFKSQYEEEAREALTRLFYSLDDGTFYNHVLSAFDTLRERLYHLQEELKRYKEQKSHIAANDPALKQIKNQILVTKKLYGTIKSQSLIEYMTDAGLLPNYAFPETGVKLEANVCSDREKEDAEQNAGEPKVIELVRPASQGIRELAPGNLFYTQGFKLEVNGISTFNWNEALTQMRFCAKCDAVALKGEPDFDSARCPKCGDPSWGVNMHAALKYTTARSRMHRGDAALDDSNEERDPADFILKRHYMFHHNGPITSYAMKPIGFGIEFCNNMELCEVNYGMLAQQGAKREVDGNNMVPDNGFVVCRHCGKATPLLTTAADNSDELHYRFCTHKDHGLADDSKGEVFEKLYLYRRLQTEAIKILLPVQIMEAEVAVEMFKAGIEQGMKAYYKSSPEHLRIDSYEEFNRATENKDHYLVMYDTIPGGTGYLSKLYDTEEFTRLLQMAYENIRDCDCQQEGKDGCYHCILTYGNQYRRERFSREQAEMMFEQLIAHKSSWEMLSGSVGTATTSGGAEDSELELKFVGVLKTISQRNGWRFEKVPDTISYYYDFEIKDDETGTNILYRVVPQFSLNEFYGVRHYTVADFQLTPVRAQIDGAEIADMAQLPMWAVFLDGYAFHAQAPHLRFYGDKEKRDGISTSSLHRMCSWTLTWEDIRLFEEDRNDELSYVLDGQRSMENNVNRLFDMLRYPLWPALKEQAFGCIIHANNFMGHGGELYQGEITVDDSAYNQLTDDSSDEEVAKALDKAVKYNWHLQHISDTVGKDEWISFWRRYNLLQFFPNEAGNTQETNAPSPEVDRDRIKEIYPGLEHIVDQLLDNHIPFSYDGDVEVVDEDGIVVASAAMLLPDKKIAIDPAPGSEAKFRELGYSIMTAEEFDINEITA